MKPSINRGQKALALVLTTATLCACQVGMGPGGKWSDGGAVIPGASPTPVCNTGNGSVTIGASPCPEQSPAAPADTTPAE